VGNIEETCNQKNNLVARYPRFVTHKPKKSFYLIYIASTNSKMMNKNKKVLAINSLPAHGNAGLKMVMHALGTKVIPVPSLMLTGIGSIKNIKKYEIPFESMLKNTLELAGNLDEEIILYVGYLGSANQIQVIKESIQEFKEIISQVVIDPVCGDHGRAYVAEDIIENWGELIGMSDLCLPNITEIALINKQIHNFNLNETTRYINSFTKSYPNTALIVTSLEEDDELINKLIIRDQTFESRHRKLSKNFGGSGDAFASYLIDFYYYQSKPLNIAMSEAGEAVKNAIAYTIKNNEPFLMLP